MGKVAGHASREVSGDLRSCPKVAGMLSNNKLHPTLRELGRLQKMPHTGNATPKWLTTHDHWRCGASLRSPAPPPTPWRAFMAASTSPSLIGHPIARARARDPCGSARLLAAAPHVRQHAEFVCACARGPTQSRDSARCSRSAEDVHCAVIVVPLPRAATI